MLKLAVRITNQKTEIVDSETGNVLAGVTEVDFNHRFDARSGCAFRELRLTVALDECDKFPELPQDDDSAPVRTADEK